MEPERERRLFYWYVTKTLNCAIATASSPKAQEELTQLVSQHGPKSEETFFESFKSGVLLIMLINLAFPDAIDLTRTNVKIKSPITRMEQLSNCEVGLKAAGEIGCKITNISKADIAEGRSPALSTILIHLMWLDVTSRVNLRQFPSLVSLKSNYEDLSRFSKSTKAELLLKWVNLQLIRAKQSPIEKILGDLKPAIWEALFKQIAPDAFAECNGDPNNADYMSTLLNVARTKVIGDSANRIALEVDDVLKPGGTPVYGFLYEAFLSELFQTRNGLDTSQLSEDQKREIFDVYFKSTIEMLPPIRSPEVMRVVQLAKNVQASEAAALATSSRITQQLLPLELQLQQQHEAEQQNLVEKNQNQQKQLQQLELQLQQLREENQLEHQRTLEQNQLHQQKVQQLELQLQQSQHQSQLEGQQQQQTQQLQQENQQLQQQTQQLQQENQQLQQQTQQFQQENQQLQQQLQQLQQENQQNQQQVQQLQSQLQQQQEASATKKKSSSQSKAAETAQQDEERLLLQQQILQLQQQHEQSFQNLQQRLKDLIQEKDNAIADLQQSLRHEQAKAQDLHQQTAEANKIELDALRKEYEDKLKKKEREARRATDLVQLKMNELEMHVKQASTELAQVKQTTEEKTREFTATIQSKEDQITDLHDTIKAKLREIKNLERDIEDLRLELERNKEALAREQKNYVDLIEEKKHTETHLRISLEENIAVIRSKLQSCREDFYQSLFHGGDEVEEKVCRWRFPKLGVMNMRSNDREGWLLKQGSSWKSWKRRFCIMKDYWFFYYESDNSAEPSGFMCVVNCKCEPASAETKKEFAFKIMAATRTLYCVAESKDDRDAWVAALTSSSLTGITSPSNVPESLVSPRSSPSM